MNPQFFKHNETRFKLYKGDGDIWRLAFVNKDGNVTKNNTGDYELKRKTNEANSLPPMFVGESIFMMVWFDSYELFYKGKIIMTLHSKKEHDIELCDELIRYT
jgi:hypothetical protein